jgi:hypothetical protein
MMECGLPKTKSTEATWQKKVNAFFARQSKDKQPVVIQPPVRCSCSFFQDQYDEQKKRGLNPDPPEICPSCKCHVVNFKFRVHQQKKVALQHN